jgi:hypothetical protein
VKSGFLLGLLILLGAAAWQFRQSSKLIWELTLNPYLGRFDRTFLHQILSAFVQPWVLLAGVLAGLAGSVRVAGLAAGGIVVLIGILIKKRSALPALLVYILSASLIVFLAWPFLWGAGLPGLIRAIKTMSRFPLSLSVLFDGVYYDSGNLPTFYLLKLVLIQFTEPVVAGFLFGLVIYIINTWKRQQNPQTTLLLLFWFVVPFSAVLISSPTMFDNFRHSLFFMPPLLLFAGIGFDWLFGVLKKKWAAAALALLIIFPGIFALFANHPYQYIYYNQFIGGPKGAAGKYELDYWATSLREGIDYLNQVAEPGADVVVSGNAFMVYDFARPDLQIFQISKYKSGRDPFYALILVRFNAEEEYYPELPIIYTVESGGAALTIIRQSD